MANIKSKETSNDLQNTTLFVYCRENIKSMYIRYLETCRKAKHVEKR